MKIITKKNENKIKTKGNCAGGCNTNKNGLSYETLTELNTEFLILNKNKYALEIKFNNDTTDNIFMYTNKSKFFKYIDKYIDKNVPLGHGCKNPDECFINEKNKTIFIIEKKFQQVNGSVCEKVQTSDFKLWQYKRTIPTYNIVYIYVLSEWFKINCKAEIEYLSYRYVPFFWGNSKTYKEDIVNFIINYKL